MILKDLISTLIESAFGSKKVFISQQSLPSVVYSQVDVPDTYNQNLQMICPCDGWARLGAKTGDANTIVLNSSSVETTINLGVPGWLCQTVPIRKGSTIYYRITGASGVLQFIRSIGGGANRLLSPVQAWIRGGVLWLTSSIISARSLSCRVRKRFQQTKTGLFSQTRKRMVLTPHPVMGISASITTILAPASSICIQMQKKALAELRRSNTLAGIAQAEQFLLKKAMLSNGYRTLRLLKCGSFPQLDRNSLNAKEVCHA